MEMGDQSLVPDQDRGFVWPARVLSAANLLKKVWNLFPS